MLVSGRARQPGHGETHTQESDMLAALSALRSRGEDAEMDADDGADDGDHCEAGGEVGCTACNERRGPEGPARSSSRSASQPILNGERRARHGPVFVSKQPLRRVWTTSRSMWP